MAGHRASPCGVTVAGQRRTFTGFPHCAPRIRAAGAPSLAIHLWKHYSTPVPACQRLAFIRLKWHRAGMIHSSDNGTEGIMYARSKMSHKACREYLEVMQGR